MYNTSWKLCEHFKRIGTIAMILWKQWATYLQSGKLGASSGNESRESWFTFGRLPKLSGVNSRPVFEKPPDEGPEGWQSKPWACKEEG